MPSEMVLQLVPSRPHFEEGAGTPWTSFTHVCICAVCCSSLQPGSRQKGLPRSERGLAQPRTPPWALQAQHGPYCCLRAWWLGESHQIHPHLRDGDAAASWPPTPGGAQRGGAQHPWAMLSHSPQAPVTIEGPMLPSAGLAAQEQQELCSALLEASHPKHARPQHSCTLTVLPHPVSFW